MMSFIQFSKNKINQRKKILKKFFVWFFVVISFLFFISLLLNDSFLEEYPHGAKTEEHFSYDFFGDIYFNDMDGFDAYSQLTYDVINSASDSIHMAMYSISDQNIVQLLNKKKQAGVDVQIIIPKSKGIQHEYTFGLTNLEPIEVGSISSRNESTDSGMNGELMHHKFILVDADTDNRQLLFGSSNLTYLQQKFDSSFQLYTRDAFMIYSFFEEFKLLKRNINGLKKIRSGTFQPFTSKGVYSNGFMETWFGPGFQKNSIKERILKDIEEAKHSIDIIGWRINDIDILNALVRSTKRGVAVRILVDDYYMWDELSVSQRTINSHAIQVASDSYMHVIKDNIINFNEENISDNFNPFLHHHALIIDDINLIAGSNNWTQGGFFYNDESIIVTNIDTLVTEYREEFDYLYNLLVADTFNFNLDNNKLEILDFEYSDTSSLVVYIEKSNPHWEGEICYQTFINQNTKIIIPDICITDTTRFFITEGDTLKASAYIYE